MCRHFQKNQNLVINIKVYTCDMKLEKAFACKVSNSSFAVPRLTSEDYMQVLQTFCLGNKGILLISILKENFYFFRQIEITFVPLWKRIGNSIIYR